MRSTQQEQTEDRKCKGNPNRSSVCYNNRQPNSDYCQKCNQYPQPSEETFEPFTVRPEDRFRR